MGWQHVGIYIDFCFFSGFFGTEMFHDGATTPVLPLNVFRTATSPTAILSSLRSVFLNMFLSILLMSNCSLLAFVCSHATVASYLLVNKNGRALIITSSHYQSLSFNSKYINCNNTKDKVHVVQLKLNKMKK